MHCFTASLKEQQAAAEQALKIRCAEWQVPHGAFHVEVVLRRHVSVTGDSEMLPVSVVTELSAIDRLGRLVTGTS